MTAEALRRLDTHLQQASVVRWRGRVVRVTGNLIESEGPFASIGEACEISTSSGETLTGEVIGLRGDVVLSMVAESPIGIRRGDIVTALGSRPCIGVGPEMLGRLLDSKAKSLDDRPPYRCTSITPIDRQAPQPFDRAPIREPLGCGIRALDAFVSCGRGQRIGIFGGSGVGKSTLLSMMARGTAADVVVMALVGERGREVAEFLEALGPEGRRRSVVVVSTSNESPLLRLRAPMLATAVAEAFAAEGRHVLLVVDSLTRFAMAQREIGLAAGEPPTAKGYTPSVLNKLASLVERAGNFRCGSITAFYTVLMEGDDQQDPVVDAVRSLLDGHIILDRALAVQGHYPPIAILDSLSRLMPSITSPQHRKKADDLRGALAAYTRSEDLIRIGAYQKGSDPVLDRAVDILPDVRTYLRQGAADLCSFEQALAMLEQLPG